MKIELIEHGQCFEVGFTAETLKEASLLVRLGKNATKEIRAIDAHAHNDGTLTGFIVIGKHKQASSSVRRNR